MSWVRDRNRREAEERGRLRSSLLLSVAALTGLVVVGTVVMRWLEGWSWITSFYFSVTTLTTVGYGDHYPTHDTSRLFVAFYVIAGVTTALSAMTVVGRNYLEFIERRLMRDRWRLRHRRHHHPHHDQSSP
jgi:Ion channel